MIDVPLTEADIGYLKQRLTFSDYAGGYHYLYEVVQRAVSSETDEDARGELLMTANGLLAAKSINNRKGSWVSDLVLRFLLRVTVVCC